MRFYHTLSLTLCICCTSNILAQKGIDQPEVDVLQQIREQKKKEKKERKKNQQNNQYNQKRKEKKLHNKMVDNLPGRWEEAEEVKEGSHEDFFGLVARNSGLYFGFNIIDFIPQGTLGIDHIFAEYLYTSFRFHFIITSVCPLAATIIPAICSATPKLSLRIYQYNLRWLLLPFKSEYSPCIGMDVIYRTMNATLASDYTILPEDQVLSETPTVEIGVNFAVKNVVLQPEIGILKRFDTGFAIMLIVGYQFIVYKKNTLETVPLTDVDNILQEQGNLSAVATQLLVNAITIEVSVGIMYLF